MMAPYVRGTTPRFAIPRRGLMALGVLAAMVGITGLGIGPAFAYWETSDSSNAATALAAMLNPPVVPTAIANDATDIAVGWSPPASQLSGANYVVTRTSGPGSQLTVCTVASTATSCQDTGLVPGSTYGYSIRATLPSTSWQSSVITSSATTPKVTPTVTTAANPASVTVGGSPDDQATLSGGYNPTGTIIWKVFASTDTHCTGTVYFTSGAQGVNGDSLYTSSSYTTAAAGTYIWYAAYGGDASNNAVTACGGTSEALTVNKAVSSLGTSASSTTVGSGVTDTATLSGGYDATGTVTYTLYGPSTSQACATQVGQVTSTVNGNGSYTSPFITPVQAGTYWWIANYGGDANNQATANACGQSGETSTVAKVTPTIATTANPASVIVGGSVGDNASISAGFSPAGTITWKAFASSDTSCSGTVFYTSSAQTVNGNATYTLPVTSFTTTSVGTYIWFVSYSGDGNNNPVTECGGANETLTVTRQSPTVSATGPSTGTAGVAIGATNIMSTLSGSYNATGTVTFTVFGPQITAPNSCSPGGTVVGTAAVTGDGTYHASAVFTPATAGDYWWYASYGGDTNNNGAVSACGAAMSETVVSAGTYNGTTGSGITTNKNADLTVPYPAGTQANDLLLLILVNGSQQASDFAATDNAGWTQLANPSSNSQAFEFQAFYHVAADPAASSSDGNTSSTGNKTTVSSASLFTGGANYIGWTITDSLGFIPAGTIITAENNAPGNKATISQSATGTSAVDKFTVTETSVTFAAKAGMSSLTAWVVDYKHPSGTPTLATAAVQSGTTGAASTMIPGNVVTSAPNATAISLAAIRAANPLSLSTSYGYTLRDTRTSSPSGGVSTAFGIADQFVPTSGSTPASPNWSQTGTAAQWAWITIAFS